MFRLIPAVCLFFPLATFAQTTDLKSKTSPIPLQELAALETQNSGVESHNASEVNVTSSAFLKLQDPGLNTEVSPWKWTVGLRLQNLAPAGAAEMRNGQILDLDKIDSVATPFLEVGTFYRLSPRAHGTWSIGTTIEGGSTSRATSVTFPSGLEAPNSRLTTNFAGASLLGTYRHPALPSIEARAGWSEGVVTYSHASNNDGANFADSARFGGWRIGLSYEASRNWLIGIEQNQRRTKASGNSGISGQDTSFSTRVTW